MKWVRPVYPPVAASGITPHLKAVIFGNPMDEVLRTNPTATVTARDFAKVVKPVRLEGLSPEDWNAALKLAEERGMALAARLSIEHKDGRLPSYIWAIAFGQD